MSDPNELRFLESAVTFYISLLKKIIMRKNDKKQNQSVQSPSSRVSSPQEAPKVDELKSDHSAYVEVDLREYCRVVYDYQQAQALNLTDRINKLDAILSVLRSQLIQQYASGLAGNKLWDEILQGFQNNLDGDISNSFVMKTMNITFIEFLKNSMDAMIKGVLDKRIKFKQAILILEINAWLQGDALHMKVQDNAIGFSEDYIQSFSQILNSKSYLSLALLSDDESGFVSDKKRLADFYFGGRCMGLRMFYAMLLDGVELNRSINIHQYDIPPLSTGVQISNREDEIRGAKIEFFGPIQPLMSHQRSSIDEFFFDDLPDLATTETDSSLHRSFSMYARRMCLHTKEEKSIDAEDILSTNGFLVF